MIDYNAVPKTSAVVETLDKGLIDLVCWQRTFTRIVQQLAPNFACTITCEDQLNLWAEIGSEYIPKMPKTTPNHKRCQWSQHRIALFWALVSTAGLCESRGPAHVLPMAKIAMRQPFRLQSRGAEQLSCSSASLNFVFGRLSSIEW